MNIVLSGYTTIFNENNLRNLLRAEGEDMPKGQRKLLEKMQSSGAHRFLVKPTSIQALDDLNEKCPNFSEVVAILKRYIKLGIEGEEAVSFPPLLLTGEPGIGKTHFAQCLADTLKIESEFISMSSLTAGWILSGSAHNWQGAKAGRVVKKLIDSPVANSLMIVDEIDKAGGDKRHDPLGSLYELLEPATAVKFVDEYVEFPVDCSHLNWVFTANDISSIPKPILSRMRVIEVPKPTVEQVRTLSSKMYRDLLKEHRWKVEPELREEVLAILGVMEPRLIKKLLWEALGEAKIAEQNYISAASVSKILKQGPQAKQSIGFY